MGKQKQHAPTRAQHHHQMESRRCYRYSKDAKCTPSTKLAFTTTTRLIQQLRTRLVKTLRHNLDRYPPSPGVPTQLATHFESRPISSTHPQSITYRNTNTTLTQLLVLKGKRQCGSASRGDTPSSSPSFPCTTILHPCCALLPVSSCTCDDAELSAAHRACIKSPPHHTPELTSQANAEVQSLQRSALRKTIKLPPAPTVRPR